MSGIDNPYADSGQDPAINVRDAYTFLAEFWSQHMHMDTYIPIVRDNPRNIERKLNLLQWWAQYVWQNQDSDGTDRLMSLMHITQAAFMLGYLESRTSLIEDSMLPKVIQEL